MAQQDAHVEAAHPLALVPEGSRAGEPVVGEVARQEERRHRDRGAHAGPVGVDSPGADETVAEHEQHGAGGVQPGIHGGEHPDPVGGVFHGRSSGCAVEE